MIRQILRRAEIEVVVNLILRNGKFPLADLPIHWEQAGYLGRHPDLNDDEWRYLCAVPLEQKPDNRRLLSARDQVYRNNRKRFGPQHVR